MNRSFYELIKLLEENHTENPLEELIAFLCEKNYINKDIQEILKNLIKFSDTIVREIMIPRTEMVTVSSSITYQELLKTFENCGFSRLPVFSNDIDNIVGIVYSKDVLTYSQRASESLFNIERIVKEPFFVPETKKIAPLLKEFKERKLKIAVVVDEFGGVSGLVTLIDIVEEIIGDFEDESNIENLYKIEQLGDNRYLVDSKVPIEQIEEELNIKIEDGPYDTIGGFFIKKLGRMPEKEEEIKLGNAVIKVNEIYEKGIKNLAIKITA